MKAGRIQFHSVAELFAVFRHVTVTFYFIFISNYIFSALRGMQTRSSNENSVRLSVKRVDCDKTEERSVQIFIPYERSFSLVF